MEDKVQKKLEVDLNDILSKIKSRSQFEDFFQSAGKHNILKKGYYFPNFPHSNSDFAFQVLKGEKKVSHYFVCNFILSFC